MTVKLDIRDGVARLTLARPDAFNSLDLATAESLLAGARRIAADTAVRVVVLSGEGKAFCGGGDVKVFAEHATGDPDTPEGLPHFLRVITTPLHAAVSTLARLDAPLIAAVHGTAAGAGLSLALAADLVIAAEGTRFTMAYTGVGLSPDGSSTWYLPRIVGLRRATELVLTNRVLDADEACTLGIVTRVVPADDLTTEVDALAAQLAVGPTRAYGAAKRLLLSSTVDQLETHLELESREIAAMGRTADGVEGVQAFAQKRKPTFHGR